MFEGGVAERGPLPFAQVLAEQCDAAPFPAKNDDVIADREGPVPRQK